MVRISQTMATRGDYRCASYASMAGAFLFMLSFICFAIALGQESQAEAKKQDNFAKYKQLEPTIVYELWEGRRKSQTAHLLGELTASIGWLALLPAVGSLGQVAGGQDGRSAVRRPQLTEALAVISTLTLSRRMTRRALYGAAVHRA